MRSNQNLHSPLSRVMMTLLSAILLVSLTACIGGSSSSDDDENGDADNGDDDNVVAEDGNFTFSALGPITEENDPPRSLTVQGDHLYFVTIEEGEEFPQFWRTDGTNDGTQLVAEIEHSNTREPHAITVFDDEIYFIADFFQSTREDLMKLDDSENGLDVVIESIINRSLTETGWLAVQDGDMYFPMENPDDSFEGHELYFIDPKAPDPEPESVKQINPDGDADPDWFRPTDGQFFFRADTGEYKDDVGTAEIGLWTTDGTPEGTQELDVVRKAATNFHMKAFNDKVLYRRDWSGSWLTTLDTRPRVSDGTVDGTEPLIDDNDIEMFGYFAILDEDTALFGADGDLWRTDGTPEGTERITDDPEDNPGSIRSDSTDVLDGYLYFESFQDKIWRTDGTAEGTEMLTNEGMDEGVRVDLDDPNHFTAFEGNMLFKSDQELWVMDDPSELPRTIKPEVATESNPLTAGSADFPFQMKVLDDALYVSAEYTVESAKVWKVEMTD